MVPKYGVKHVGQIDQFTVAVCTTDGTSEVSFDMLTICMYRRGLTSQTVTSINTSHNIDKICVLKRALDLTNIE